MGASRWLTVERHRTSADCLAYLREREIQVFASDCPPVVKPKEEERAKPEHWRDHRSGETEFDAVPIEQLPFVRASAG
jgi:hypothetical protein